MLRVLSCLLSEAAAEVDEVNAKEGKRPPRVRLASSRSVAGRHRARTDVSDEWDAAQRLFFADLPGEPAGVLTIAVMTGPEESEETIGETAPIIDSVQIDRD